MFTQWTRYGQSPETALFQLTRFLSELLSNYSVFIPSHYVLLYGGAESCSVSVCSERWAAHVTLTWVGHAPLKLLESFHRQRADLVLQTAMAVRRQVPKARLPLAVPAQLVAGFAEAAVEAQVVADGVLPAIGRRLKEGEVLPGRGQGRDTSSYTFLLVVLEMTGGRKAEQSHLTVLGSRKNHRSDLVKW